jgi:hypothetical protein
VPLELGDRFHQPAESAFLEGDDADERIASADQDVQISNQRFD